MAAPTDAPSRPDTRTGVPPRPDVVSVGGGWTTLRRNWWVVAVVAIIVVLVQSMRLGAAAPRYEANATVFLGAPLGPAGLQINTVGSQAVTGVEIATGDEAVRTAAKRAGISEPALRSGLAVRPVQSPIASRAANPPQLVKITVRSSNSGRAERAARSLADTVARQTGRFGEDKVTALEQSADAYDRAVAEQRALRSTAMRAIAKHPTGDAAAIWALALSTVSTGVHLGEAEAADARAQALGSRELETSRVLTHPAAHRVSTASQRPALVAAMVLGLVLGCAAALLVGWITRPRGR